MNQAAQRHSQDAVAAPVGADIISALKRSGITYVVAVPDIVTSAGLLWPISKDPDLKLVRICKEDEGVSICAAMSYSNTRVILLMQQIGLLDSINALRAMAMDYQLPICMMVGFQGKEPHLPPHQSKAYGVRVVPPILDAMSLGYDLIEGPEETDKIVPAIEQAYQNSAPHCFLIGRAPEAP
jgi:sulfopyruvate decarboxylase subunit alpha